MNGCGAKRASILDAKIGLFTLTDPRQHKKYAFSIFIILTSLRLKIAFPVITSSCSGYLSIIEPSLSYCCSAWGCCCDTKLNTLQKLQNRAARIITNSPFDSPAAPLLQRLEWLPVDRLVHRETSCMVHKSLNGLAPDNVCQIFSRLSDIYNWVNELLNAI